MPFLPPNQQSQSTEGTRFIATSLKKSLKKILFGISQRLLHNRRQKKTQTELAKPDSVLKRKGKMTERMTIDKA